MQRSHPHVRRQLEAKSKLHLMYDLYPTDLDYLSFLLAPCGLICNPKLMYAQMNRAMRLNVHLDNALYLRGPLAPS